ncbi:CynX/NimT family MFS transporter [Levilactobacillus bambusae]|uniref:MFS transporter n=1 Tax=Levilactobacillus bambusae TaxID=2024736 RepID=A0A2V1N1F1_9LACO|nr:MFS transporter [Levilactobacillus bambusae]PWG00140.1 MFS transporter [Levilactobacillus bambusae]
MKSKDSSLRKERGLILQGQKHSRYLTLGLIMVAANMRLPITMMPGLLPMLKRSLGMPSSMAGLLTTIPLLTFAVVSPLLARLGRRYGNEFIIYVTLIILALGSYLRIIPSMAWLFFGTLLVGIGIDGGNVLIPAVIKDCYPNRMSVKTSEYTLTMVLVGAVGTGLSGVLATRWSLQISLALLSVIGLINLVVWLPNLRFNHRDLTLTSPTMERPQHRSVWGVKLAWVVTAFFGLQAFVYYSLLTWLPTIFTSRGLSTVAAANLVTLLQLSGLPMTFSTPLVAERQNGTPIILSIIGVGFIGGTLGILLPINALWWWIICCILMGLGSAAAFSLAVVFFTQKTTNGFETADLSGMAQSAGYLLAAVGPVLFGYVGGLIGWNAVLILAAIFSVLLVISGVVVAKRRSIFG